MSIKNSLNRQKLKVLLLGAAEFLNLQIMRHILQIGKLKIVFCLARCGKNVFYLDLFGGISNFNRLRDFLTVFIYGEEQAR